MNKDIHPLLMCRRLPGRLDADGAATLLGFREHDVGILVSQKLLKPLGKPGQRSMKYFATKYLLSLADDQVWLDRATKVLAETWRSRNAKKFIATEPAETPVLSAVE